MSGVGVGRRNLSPLTKSEAYLRATPRMEEEARFLLAANDRQLSSLKENLEPGPTNKISGTRLFGPGRKDVIHINSHSDSLDSLMLDEKNSLELASEKGHQA